MLCGRNSASEKIAYTQCGPECVNFLELIIGNTRRDKTPRHSQKLFKDAEVTIKGCIGGCFFSLVMRGDWWWRAAFGAGGPT